MRCASFPIQRVLFSLESNNHHHDLDLSPPQETLSNSCKASEAVLVRHWLLHHQVNSQITSGFFRFKVTLISLNESHMLYWASFRFGNIPYFRVTSRGAWLSNQQCWPGPEVAELKIMIE